MIQIPITYVGGTGGHFLCYMLNAAYSNIHSPVKLSTTGNAHDSSLGICIGGGLDSDVTVKKSKILEWANLNVQNKKFVAVHCTDFKFLLSNFQKMIVITYSEENIKEIAYVFINKWLDQSSTKSEATRRRVLVTTIKYTNLLELYTDKLLSSNTILNVSWDNLFKGDIHELISSLSEFTQIPVSNFNTENLIYWRKLTNDGLINCEK